MVSNHDYSKYDPRWASGVAAFEPPPNASVTQSPVAPIDVDDRDCINGSNLKYLKNGDWDAIGMQNDEAQPDDSQGEVAPIEVEILNLMTDLYRNWLEKGEWSALALPVDVVQMGDRQVILSPVRELTHVVTRSGDRALLRLLAQFLIAMRVNAIERLAYVELLNHWQITRYQAFIERVVTPSDHDDLVPLPIHARPRPPSAPLAPPALLTAS